MNTILQLSKNQPSKIIQCTRLFSNRYLEGSVHKHKPAIENFGFIGKTINCLQFPIRDLTNTQTSIQKSLRFRNLGFTYGSKLNSLEPKCDLSRLRQLPDQKLPLELGMFSQSMEYECKKKRKKKKKKKGSCKPTCGGEDSCTFKISSVIKNPCKIGPCKKKC